MHSDVPPDAAGSGVFGWLLAMLGQDVGFPVPQGGAAAARRRAAAAGRRRRRRRCAPAPGSRRSSWSGGRAVGVRLADGTTVVRRTRGARRRGRARALPRPGRPQHLPAAVRAATCDRFQWDNPTLKVNWALDRPLPWRAEAARGAGTVHLGADSDGLVDVAADLSVGRVPERPFVLFGQMTTADATRSPAGHRVGLGLHPRASRRGLDPGGDRRACPAGGGRRRAGCPRVRGHRGGPARAGPRRPAGRRRQPGRGRDQRGDLGAAPAAVHAAHPGARPARDAAAGLYLAGASAHPGGGVHGACGWNAARAALASSGRAGAAKDLLVRTAWGRLLKDA